MLRHIAPRPRQLLALPALAVAVVASGLVAASAAVSAPANDAFATAQVLAPSDAVRWTYGSTTGATTEVGEPRHAGASGGASIWYAWTARTDATVAVSSHLWDSSTYLPYGHSLAVYAGDSLPSLTPLTGAGPAVVSPSLSFQAIAGRTYRIAIRASDEQTGETELYLRAVPANDPFSEPQPLEGATGSLSSSNVSASRQDLEPEHGGRGGRSVWYRWTAPSDGVTRFDTAGSSFDTLLAVYTGAQLSSLDRVAVNDDCRDDSAETATTSSCVTFDAVEGTVYAVAVDGSRFASGEARLGWRTEARWSEGPCDISGTVGDDVLVGTSGDDVICGLAGDDRLLGGAGADTIVGGEGHDTVSFLDAEAGVVADLVAGSATGHGADTLDAVESIIGSAHDDTLRGGGGPNTIVGATGNDRLWGMAGDDAIQGGQGADSIRSGSGDDELDGGGGRDTADFSTSPAVAVDLRRDSASGDGADSLRHVENVTGSRFDDQLRGDRRVNVLRGGAGTDQLHGGRGGDELFGSGGSDVLTGAGGWDACDGGRQVDTAVTCDLLISVR